MRKLPVIWLLMLVLGAVVLGCGGAHRYDCRLTAVDSLMRNHPDSALKVLESLSLSDLSTDGDRAYRDLLLTQARYKAYIPATNDSDIARALAYYRAHPSDQEKLTRAYLYKGAILDELGFPDSAMLYYKQAESVASPDDYFNQGCINMRIAVLYQSYYYNDSAVIDRMLIANHYFELVNETEYLITTIGTIGLYDERIGKDSSRYYLQKAVSLGQAIKSDNRFFYQSKLAGSYFYDNDYLNAKKLALDIILNGQDYCDETQYFYYAARSYIKLNNLDSAKWVQSLIPKQINAVDSMNNYLLLAEMTLAEGQYSDHSFYYQKADMIHDRLMKSSINSGLIRTELHFDATQQENKLISHFNSSLVQTITFFILVIALLSVIGIIAMQRRRIRYQNKLDYAQHVIEQLMADSEKEMAKLNAEHLIEQENLKKIFVHKDQELDEMKMRYKELETKQSGISEQVALIVRSRNEAFRELYQGMRVKSGKREKRTVIPLIGLFKDLNEKKRILHTTPTDSFWMNLKISVDGEYNGISTFVEKKYPLLSVKDRHLFLLMCAKLPNQIIKICMNYTSEVTVSNNKRRLIKEKMGVDMKFEDFIELYLKGKI